MKIVVVTMYSPCYSKIAEVTLPIMKAYCDKRGYDFHEIKVEDERWHYRKHRWFNEVIMKGGTDVIFYIDIDVMITNHTIKVESFLDDEHELYLTKDVNEINSGTLIFKTNVYGKWMNDLILDCIGVYENEQNAINFLYNCNDRFKNLTKIATHPAFNSYDYSLYQELPHIRKREDGHWHKEDFVFHVPALSFEKRIEVLNDYKQHIIYE